MELFWRYIHNSAEVAHLIWLLVVLIIDVDIRVKFKIFPLQFKCRNKLFGETVIIPFQSMFPFYPPDNIRKALVGRWRGAG